jgi:hypothetical protein
MPDFVVLAKDLRQDDDFVIGPFFNDADAYKWAKADADEKAKAYKMEDGTIDTNHEDYLSLTATWNDEMVYEWQVMQLITP